VFGLIAEAGRVPAEVMYATFNMGIGFCVVVPPAQEQATIDALRGAGEQPVRIGVVTPHPGRSVTIPSAALTGHGETFTPTS
jgi:phosphoribosylformylglycinamidine cyclo-ligase